MQTPLTEVDQELRINGLTLTEYCDDPEKVRSDAIADGVTGETYTHYKGRKGRLTGDKVIRYKALNNGDLYQYAKQKYRKGETDEVIRDGSKH